MKIWIDVRIGEDWWFYKNFVEEIITKLWELNSEHNITVFRKEALPKHPIPFVRDQKIKKIYEREKFGLMLFFDVPVPHGYAWDYILIIESLKEVFFPKKKYFSRKLFQHQLQKAIAKSQIVTVMDTWSTLELNEQLNISEEKIRKIHGFFPKTFPLTPQTLQTDIKTKHNLKWNYLIYDSGNELHNNFERILRALKKIEEAWHILYIIILCEATSQDLEIRNKALEYGISEKIIFLWKAPTELEKLYYLQSSWVIFSSIYESFPFSLSKALSYNVPIFANDISSIKEVMGGSIYYLDPLSLYSMTDTIIDAIMHPKKPDYSDVYEKFSSEKSALELMKLIEMKN